MLTGRAKTAALIAWWRQLTVIDRLRYSVMCAIPVAGMVYVATLYAKTWYLFDEWPTLRRSLGPLNGLFGSNEGHLVMFSHLLYSVQRSTFGLDGHEVLWAALILSLAAMQITLAMLLRRLGMSAVFALLVATIVTYFGPASQNVTYEFHWHQNTTFALTFLAAFIALGNNKTTKTAVAVSALLVLAVAADSQLAAFAIVPVATMVLILWPRRLAFAALGPPVLAHLAWFTFGYQGPIISAPFERMWTFANRLLLQSAAGLVGGGETGTIHEGVPRSPVIPISSGKLGLLVLLIAAAVVAFGIFRHRLSRPVVAALIGGSFGTLVSVGALAKTRAFFITPSLSFGLISPEQAAHPNFFGSRYLQYVALFLVIALAPAIAASVRNPQRASNRAGPIVVALALIAIFVANLSQLGPVVRYYEQRGQASKRLAAEAITLIRNDCGPTRKLINDSKSYDALSPEITVGLLRKLLARGSFPPTFGLPPTPETRDAVCRPANR